MGLSSTGLWAERATLITTALTVFICLGDEDRVVVVPLFDKAGASLVLPVVPVLLCVEDVLSGRDRV